MRMISAGVILLCAVAAWAADKYQPINVKVGLWESTISVKTSGAMPVPEEFLARLTPEQRARVEERMKSSEASHTSTKKSCVSKEDLEKGLNFGQDSKECTHTIITSTSSKLEMRYSCQSPQINGSGTMTFEALSPESVKGFSQGSISAGGHTRQTNTTFVSKWVGPVCSKSDQ